MNGEVFPVGTVVGFHGLSGAMKVKYSTNRPDLLLTIKDVSVTTKSGNVIASRVKSAKLEKGHLVLQLQGFDSRTASEELLGAKIIADRKKLDALDQDEWWIDDLVGLQVFTTDGTPVGTICSIIDASGQLLEIKKKDATDADTILVPFVKQLVPVVDIAKGRVEIVNMPGLID